MRVLFIALIALAGICLGQHDHSRHIDRDQIIKIATDVAAWTEEEWAFVKREHEAVVQNLEILHKKLTDRDGPDADLEWRKLYQKKYDKSVETLMVLSLSCQFIHKRHDCKIGQNIWNWGKLGTRSAQFKAEFLNEINEYLKHTYLHRDL